MLDPRSRAAARRGALFRLLAGGGSQIRLIADGGGLGSRIAQSVIDEGLRFEARHRLAVVAAAAPVAPLGCRVSFLLGLSLGLGLFLQQRLPVRDRDLIVVGMNFVEGEEAVAVAAVVDEGGLQRGLYTRDLCQIDVAAEQFA